MRGEDVRPPGRAGDRSGSDLDTMVEDAEDHLLVLIHRSLDLETGLAKIIGNPRLESTGRDDPVVAVGTGECLTRIDTPYARQGSAERRYLAGPGQVLHQNVIDLRAQEAVAVARAQMARRAMECSGRLDAQRMGRHRGGSSSGALRMLIPIVTLAEAVVVYLALGVLIRAEALTVCLALLVSLAAAGMARTLAGRRSRFRAGTRILEGIFVVAVTALRYEGLRGQQHGVLTAAGVAALTAITSVLALGGIEVIIAETRTFRMFLGTLRTSWKRWRYTAIATRGLTEIRTQSEAAAEQLQQDFLEFLLQAEGLPFGLARLRAVAFAKNAADSPGASPSHGERASAANRDVSGIAVRTRVTRGRTALAVTAVAAATLAVLVTGLLITGATAHPSAAGLERASDDTAMPLADPGQVTTNQVSSPSGTVIILTGETITFAPDQYQLSNAAEASLRSWLTRNEINGFETVRVTVTGYANLPGTGAYYQFSTAQAQAVALSMARAQTVAAFIATQGVPASRLAVVTADRAGADRQASSAGVSVSASVKF